METQILLLVPSERILANMLGSARAGGSVARPRPHERGPVRGAGWLRVSIQLLGGESFTLQPPETGKVGREAGGGGFLPRCTRRRARKSLPASASATPKSNFPLQTCGKGKEGRSILVLLLFGFSCGVLHLAVLLLFDFSLGVLHPAVLRGPWGGGAGDGIRVSQVQGKCPTIFPSSILAV